jgi:hypothetical protein
MIRFACPACSHIFKTAEENAGKKTLCQICKQPVQIPPAIRRVMLGIPVPEKAAVDQEEPGVAPTQPPLTTIEEAIVVGDFQSFQDTPEPIPTPAPAPPKSRAGFLVILSLAGLALLVVGGVCGWFARVAIESHAPRLVDKGTPPATGKATEPDADGESEAKQIQEIVKHPFWRVEASEKDINRILDVILTQKRGGVVFIDDRLYTSARSGGVFEEMHKKGTIMAPNDMKSERYIYIDLGYEKTGPTRREVLAQLRAELDAANR